MSVEHRHQINDIAKWILWASISVSSFLIANTYQKVEAKMDKTEDKIDKTYEKVEAIEARMIRVEYELKLK
jgi:hypothetical protein